jgi:selenocysteine lyase/cysteine desulfurase
MISSNSPATPDYDLAAWRKRIPIIASGAMVPMNNCSQAPQTDLTRAAAERYLDSWNRDGMDWEGWMTEVALAKREFATLINAAPEDIAVFSSVSEATSAVASALDFASERNKIVVSEAEFPTVGHVWLAQRARGARVEWAEVSNGAIEPVAYVDRIDDRTVIVSACHAYYLNGFVQDLEAIAARAHAHGALLFADAYQTLGAIPVDVNALGVDFLASGNLKFLMGIPGIAFLYVKPDVVQRLHPTVTGWFGRADPFAFDVKQLDWSAGASRFDSGTPPMINAYVARAGMEILNGLGVSNIRAWHQVLSRRLIDGGLARGLTPHGSTDVTSKTVSTAFVVDDSHSVEQKMRSRGIIASARGPVIRLAPHFYSTLEDCDRSLDALAESVKVA